MFNEQREMSRNNVIIHSCTITSSNCEKRELRLINIVMRYSV